MRSFAIRRRILPVVATLLLAACDGAAPATPASGATVQDDFSSAACLFGFLEAGSTQGYECVDGEFRAWIDNDQASYDFISSSTPDSYGDVRIEIDVRIVSAVLYGGAVVVCRGSQTAGDFYAFVLSPDGTVTVSDYLAGEEQIARIGRLPDGTLKPDVNHLRVDCIGDHLAFYVNGVLGVERDIDVLAQGEIGLGAGGAGDGFTEVRFDNLTVVQL
jgi:hypothetical protein